MDNKQIFKYSKSFIGGTPSVYEYYNSDRSKSIDIMTCKDSIFSMVDVHTSIGLHDINIGLTSDGKKVGIELISVGEKSDEISCNILATVAFEIMDKKECYLGQIISNIINQYDVSSEMRHVILLSPAYWDNYRQYENEKEIVAWLLLVPISDSEKAYIEKNGVAAFEQVLQQQESDITDRSRSSFI